MTEIRRVIKPGGRLVVAFRSREKIEPMKVFLRGFALYRPTEVSALLERAGFTQVRIEMHDQDKRLDAVLAIGRA